MLSVGILKVVTFQLVLVSNVHRTFILINYGDIAETDQIWLVSGNGSLLLLQMIEMRRNCPCLTSSLSKCQLCLEQVEGLKTIHLLYFYRLVTTRRTLSILSQFQ